MALFQVLHEVSPAAQSEVSCACLVAGESCGGGVPTRRSCISAQRCKVTIDLLWRLWSRYSVHGRVKPRPVYGIRIQSSEDYHFPSLGVGDPRRSACAAECSSLSWAFISTMVAAVVT